jgi:hypothetical protein
MVPFQPLEGFHGSRRKRIHLKNDYGASEVGLKIMKGKYQKQRRPPPAEVRKIILNIYRNIKNEYDL